MLARADIAKLLAQPYFKIYHQVFKGKDAKKAVDAGNATTRKVADLVFRELLKAEHKR